VDKITSELEMIINQYPIRISEDGLKKIPFSRFIINSMNYIKIMFK